MANEMDELGVRAQAFVRALYDSAQRDLKDAEDLACAALSMRESAKAKMALATETIRLSATDGPLCEALLDSELGDVAYTVHDEDGGP